MGVSLPWRDACVMARTFSRRAECETHRALNPDWWVTPEVQLLRQSEHGTRVGAWIHSQDARRKANYPKPIPLTHDERHPHSSESDRYTSMSLDDVDDFLGWGSPRGD